LWNLLLQKVVTFDCETSTINKGNPDQWQTDLLGVWLNEDNAKKKSDDLYYENLTEYPGNNDAYEVMEFDVMDA